MIYLMSKICEIRIDEAVFWHVYDQLPEQVIMDVARDMRLSGDVELTKVRFESRLVRYIVSDD
jgi:hypothetical protein